jgi:signal transduction histidine kinase
MAEPKNIRVLVVEDNEVIARLVKAMLGKRGYSVVGEATNGLTAIQMTERLQPDIVVMDVQMPDMDGITAARQIRDNCPTPVVILTALETHELVERASTAGVGAYLVKPPNPEELERAIIIAMARFNDMMELAERARELDAFAHTVAHDLKNPLGVLVGFAELLEEDYTSIAHEDVARFLQTISEKGRKAISIVDELLLLASLRRGEVPIARLDMAAIVGDVLRRLAGMIDREQAQISLPAEWPAALGYGPWVEEIWANYLDNAIKYGGRPPRAELGAGIEADGSVRFWIHDNGRGLTAQERAQLFTPFTRLDQMRVQGHGLGLSIARRIAEKLDGQVGVESSGVPGEGSRFYFSLPPAPAAPTEAESAMSRLADFAAPAGEQ